MTKRSDEQQPQKRRLEQDREDLLAEATALVERIELQIDRFAEPVFVGFRETGAGSLYFGPDAAYHFNSDRQFRRAYVASLLYKAEKGRLVSLDRQRPGGEVQLLRHELSESETTAFFEPFSRLRLMMIERIEANAYRIAGQVPEQTNLIARIIPWVLALGDCPEVAQSPRAV